MADLAQNQLHIVLVNGVIEKDGKFLIAQRSFNESHMPGWWSLPGGKVDRTEGGVHGILEKTLKREIFEEVGIKIEDNPVLILDNTFIRSTGHHVIEFCYLCHWKSGEAQPLEETIDVAWVSPSEFKNYKIHEDMMERICLAEKMHSKMISAS